MFNLEDEIGEACFFLLFLCSLLIIYAAIQMSLVSLILIGIEAQPLSRIKVPLESRIFRLLLRLSSASTLI